jgi:hypothetical protein
MVEIKDGTAAGSPYLLGSGNKRTRNEKNRGVYAALVTATGFKPGVASAKAPGGFDSHPLP